MIRLVALLPAAGRGERMKMDRPKLTLPLAGRVSVIQRVIEVLEQGGVDAVLVVAPPIERPGAVVLANHARVAGAFVVHSPSETADMRATVEVGLDALEAHVFVPDAVVLTPADMPGLNPPSVRQVLQAARQEPERIVVPTYQGRRGHPVVIPWSIARRLPELPAGLSVRELIEHESARVREVALDDAGIASDLDTPEDYRAILGRLASPERPPLSD